MEKNLLDSSWMAMKPAVSAEEGSKTQTEGRQWAVPICTLEDKMHEARK